MTLAIDGKLKHTLTHDANKPGHSRELHDKESKPLSVGNFYSIDLNLLALVLGYI